MEDFASYRLLKPKMNPQVVEQDLTDAVKAGKHRTGKGSRQKRTDAFRVEKNNKTQDSILAGIYSRLKLADPTTVSSAPLAKEVHPVVVPVTVRTLPSYVDRVWDTMEAIGTRPFGQLNTPMNKDIFKKGALILAEAKVAYAQRTTPATPDDDLPARRLYTEEELRDLNQMASSTPLPLAVYFECLGNTKDYDQVITPTPARLIADAPISGAVTWFPRQLLPLLRLFRDGVPIDGPAHAVAASLNGLPSIAFEEFHGPGVAEDAPRNMVRLTAAAANFWLSGNNIRWNDHDYRIYSQLIKSMDSKKDFNVLLDLSHGNGTNAQLVQTIDWDVSSSTQWYTMVPVDDYSIKLGATFAFGISTDVEPSRFSGSFTNAYCRGELTPRRIVSAILSNLER